MFLGICCLVFGALLFIKVFFFAIPVLFCMLFLYLGFLFTTDFRLAGSWECFCRYTAQDANHTTCMGKGIIMPDAGALHEPTRQWCYTTLAGSTVLDLTSIKPEQLAASGAPLVISLNTAWGKTRVRLNPDLPVRAESVSAFGKTVLPDNTSIIIGSHVYQSHPEQPPRIIIKSAVVFGACYIER